MRSIVLLLVLAACTPNTPEGVARAWFRAAERGNLDGTKALVAPGCDDSPVAKGAPVRLLGVPTKVEGLALTVEPDGPDRAEVKYRFEGTIDREGGTVETKVFGKDVKITTGDIHLDIGLVESELWLERIDGRWKVACPLHDLFRRDGKP